MLRPDPQSAALKQSPLVDPGHFYRRPRCRKGRFVSFTLPLPYLLYTIVKFLVIYEDGLGGSGFSLTLPDFFDEFL